MKVENMNVNDLIPYEENAKKHDETQIKNVMESIRQFGFAQPIVVDKDNVIIIGHCRLIASKRLHMTEVPVVRMENLTEEEVQKLRLLDNKLNESEWDFDLLADQIPELDFDGFDIDWGIPEIDDNYPTDLDDDNGFKSDYQITIRFDNSKDLIKTKDEIEEIVKNHNGTIAVKMV